MDLQSKDEIWNLLVFKNLSYWKSGLLVIYLQWMESWCIAQILKSVYGPKIMPL